MKKMLLALFFIYTNWAVAAADTVHPLSALHLDHPPYPRGNARLGIE
ncbi:hypothetical protein [Vibrio ostreae]|nr:hypothetical protein [Vibrio ostreae]